MGIGERWTGIGGISQMIAKRQQFVIIIIKLDTIV